MKNLLIIKSLSIFSILLYVSSTAVWATEKFVINTGFSPPVSTYFEKVLQEAGRRHGFTIELVEVSAERSLLLVESGNADADCCRIHQVINKNYPTLIDVPTSFYEMSWSAFVRDKNIQINKWEDLANYSAAAVTGYKLGVNKVQQYSPTPYVVPSHESLFGMLDKGRIDVAITSKMTGLKALKALKLDSEIQLQEPPLVQIALTLQLHPRHADKVDFFDKIFDELVQDGTADRLLEQTLDNL